MILKHFWSKIKKFFLKEKKEYIFTPYNPEEWIIYLHNLKNGTNPPMNPEVEKVLLWLEETGSTHEEAVSKLEEIVSGMQNV